jgi:hypothetical protein
VTRYQLSHFSHSTLQDIIRAGWRYNEHLITLADEIRREMRLGSFMKEEHQKQFQIKEKFLRALIRTNQDCEDILRYEETNPYPSPPEESQPMTPPFHETDSLSYMTPLSRERALSEEKGLEIICAFYTGILN